ncbi:MAG: CoA transferase [bacterium]|nr:carnitine dehydratase [Deltaproteobacteria bacterium]MCP4903748.1 CoA transferase [bacterium]
MSKGPLAGITVLEVAGIGPGPFCGMMLSDMGADVVRIDRAGSVQEQVPSEPSVDVIARGRRSVGVDLKRPEGVEAVLKMVEQADVLIEGFRPGVMERLGLGPDVCLARNPKLVFGRMTGWGQEGPMAQAAGHDINYIALAGALEPIGRMGQNPVPPLNLVGDFGGGGMVLAFGIASALVERARSGKGQVVDAAMVDGASTLMAFFHGMKAMGAHGTGGRGTNILDTGAHFYDTYETSDGKYISLGSIEPQFYAELLEKLGLKDDDLPQQMDKSGWPLLKARFETLFRTQTRDQWCALMEGTDICFAPVLSMEEAPNHPHIKHRKTYVESHGLVQPAPSPRFSRTPTELGRPPAHAGQHTDDVLASFGFSGAEIAKLKDEKAIA